MAPELRSEVVTTKVSPTELAMLKTLAEADGLSQSDVLRLALRRTWADRYGTRMPKPKRKK